MEGWETDGACGESTEERGRHKQRIIGPSAAITAHSHPAVPTQRAPPHPLPCCAAFGLRRRSGRRAQPTQPGMGTDRLLPGRGGPRAAGGAGHGSVRSGAAGNTEQSSGGAKPGCPRGTERNGSAPRGRAGGKGGYETRGGARRREGHCEGRREAAAPPSAKSRRRSQLGHPTGPGSAADRSRARPKGRLCRARARRSAPPRTALRYLRAVPGTTRGDAALPRSRSGPRPPRRPRLPQGRPTRSPPGRGRSARHAQTRLAPPRPPRSAQAHTHAHTAPLRRKRSPPRRRLTCTDRREGEPKHRERGGGKRDCGNKGAPGRNAEMWGRCSGNGRTARHCGHGDGGTAGPLVGHGGGNGHLRL